MKFGINFFPSFRPEDSTTAVYYAQCLRLAERADALKSTSAARPTPKLSARSSCSLRTSCLGLGTRRAS